MTAESYGYTQQSRPRFAGPGEIRDTVTIGTPAVPARRRVGLFARRTYLLVDMTWSDAATGEYVFSELATDTEFFVVGFDFERSYNAVIADGIYAAVPES